MFQRMCKKAKLALEGKMRDQESTEDVINESERRGILAWLAQNGKTIADSMFRDAGLFNEDKLKEEKKSSNGDKGS